MFIDGVGDAPIHNTLLSIITMDLSLEVYLYRQWQLKDFKGVGLMPIIHDLDKKIVSELWCDVSNQFIHFWTIYKLKSLCLFLEFNHFDL